MSELKPCPFCRGEGEIENAEKKRNVSISNNGGKPKA